MRDKLYEKLNGRKPPRSVLDKAEAEMRVSKRAKRSGGRTVLRWALGGAMSILIIAVAVYLVSAMGLLGGRSDKSSQSNNKNDMSYAPEMSNNNASDESEYRSAIGFDYRRFSSGDNSEAFITSDGVEVRLNKLASPSALAGERIAIEPLGTTGIIVMGEDKTEVAFVYGSCNYLLKIASTDIEIVEGILADIKIL